MKYRRCGHLFQERFKSEAVETDSYFLRKWPLGTGTDDQP